MDKLTADLTNLKNVVNDILAWCQNGEENKSVENGTLPDSTWVDKSTLEAIRFRREVCKRPGHSIAAASNRTVSQLKAQSVNREKYETSFEDLFDVDEADGDISQSPPLLQPRAVPAELCSTPAIKGRETTEDCDSDNTEDYVDTTDRGNDFDLTHDQMDLTAEEEEELKERLQSVPECFDVDFEKDETTDDFGDDFGDDFDDNVLQQIEAAEKSYSEDKIDTGVEDEGEEDPQNQPQNPKFSAVLKQYFGYSKFRPMQWRIIDSVLNEKRDNCVVMATGYGKSLCYQFPSVFTGRTTVVISPLISLMQDQVLGLQAVNIEACFLGSAQENMGQVKMELLRGKYRVVYITPEFASVASNVLQDLDSKVGIDLIAIDEAHCVSQWGHDFRVAYRSLGRIRDVLHKVPIVALTATATPEVRKDICKSLKLNNPVITCTGFDRPNLFLSASNKSANSAQDLRSMMVKQGNRSTFDGPTIIYCQTKKATMETSNILKAFGVECLPYHAGLSYAIRKDAHKRFVNDQIQVIVATVAFGMGIDKPDVRRVIHYGAPKDIESYYQELGRAGRDGMPGECHVFFAPKDFHTCRHFINKIQNETFRAHKLKMLSKMEQYLTLPSCRRRAILSHFENKAVTDVGGTNNCCDNCKRRIEFGKRQNYHGQKGTHLEDPDKPVDFSKEAIDLFGAVEAMGGRSGMGKPVLLLTGSNSQKVAGYTRHRLHGKGRGNTQKWWTALGRQLLCEGYLSEQRFQGQNSFGSTVELSCKGRTWYEKAKGSSSATLKMVPSQDLRKPNRVELVVTNSPVPVTPSYNHKPVSASWAGPAHHVVRQVPVRQVVAEPLKPQIDPQVAKLQNSLYTKLVKQRNELSQETGYLPHSIASNKVLIDMAKVRPGSLDSMKRLEDMSEARVEKFGQKFLDIIIPFTEENQVSVDVFPEKFNLEKVTGEFQQTLVTLSETKQISYVMFMQQGKSLEEVASLRGVKVSTVVTHLCDGLRAGLDIDISRMGMSDKIQQLVTEAVRAPPVSSDVTVLTKIKDQLPDHVDWHHIKVVLTLLEREHGITVLPSGQKLLGDKGAPAPSISPPGVTGYNPQTGRTSSTNNNNNATPLKFRHTTTAAAGSTPSSLVKAHSAGSVSSFHPSSLSTQESTFSQSDSQDSQSQSQSSKRKLPSWMSGGQAPKMSKKIRLNSLFR